METLSCSKEKSKDTLENDVYGYLTEDQIKKLQETGVEIKVKGLELKDATDTVLSTTKMAMNAEAILFSVVFPVLKTGLHTIDTE